jgi:hypothetical protein
MASAKSSDLPLEKATCHFRLNALLNDGRSLAITGFPNAEAIVPRPTGSHVHMGDQCVRNAEIVSDLFVWTYSSIWMIFPLLLILPHKKFRGVSAD